MRVAKDGAIAPTGGSELAVDLVRLGAGEEVELGPAEVDWLLFVCAGRGMISAGGGHAAHEGAAALALAGESTRLTAAADGLTAVLASVGPGADRHAPLGPRETVVSVDRVEAGSATGKRSFQVLFGPHNGSDRATLFVGYVPPGAAPWHFHLYDEIVWIWRGAGRLHLEGGVEELAPGSAFRLTPREVHVVENTSPTDDLVVLGLFTPAGSPSAAYLADDAAASGYAIEGMS